MSRWRAVAAVTRRAYAAFHQALHDCERAQARRLERLLRAGADSEFGRRHGFSRLADPDRFRAALPLRRYEDFAPYIQRMAAGEEKVLSGEPVRLFEETGGSSGAAKLIPYTGRSLAGFRRAVHPWLHDLATGHPGLGRAYFAISPVVRASRFTPGGVPIGAGDDLAYFGTSIARHMGGIILCPFLPGAVTDVEQWRRLTLLHLLQAEDLTLFSVWSPTFLTALLDALPRHAEGLLRQLRDGVPPPISGAASVPPSRRRAAVVARALSGAQPDTRLIWPQLRLISTWTHAGAARFIPRLQRLFPHASIQGKGLLGTEGAVSIPLVGHRYPVLAVNSGFYEFLDTAGRSYLAHEVVEGSEYEVVMSVPGLYRYRGGDRVRVRGRVGDAPQLEFIGRAGLVSDLAGEKLTDAFVSDCLRDIEGFAMLAPALEPRPGYRLFVEDGGFALAGIIERRLRRNPQYAHARDLGQLQALQVVRVERPFERYQRWALSRGQRLGDIKPPSLRPEQGWERRFCGEIPGSENNQKNSG